jgi:mono/diheme cytochrome c family protein
MFRAGTTHQCKGKLKNRQRGGGTESRRRGVALTALAVVAILGAGVYMVGRQFSETSAPAPPDYSGTALIAQGETLYAKHCAQCHGPKAVGENPAARKGGNKPDGGYWAPALNGTAHTWHHPPDVLFRIVKEGSPAKDSPMRGWMGRMSDEEIHGVLAYVKSLWPESLRRRYDDAFSAK